MNVKGPAAIAAMLAFGWSIGAPAAPRAQMIAMINDIDSHFICPETLPTDADRSVALASFAKKLAASNVSYLQATHLLDVMLKRHSCSATVAEPAPAVTEPADVAPSTSPAPVMAVASITPTH